MKQFSYKKYTFFLMLLFAIARIITASAVELGNDEAYYWVYSQQLQWNYFDHPPMVAIWARFFSANLLLQDFPVFLRLGSIVSCALSTWFIFKCVSVIKNERAGWFAACLYNASYYAGITAGLFLMPDSPQMVFYTFSMWMIARIVNDDSKWINWILFGIASGLCIMSKVHGAFIWIGFSFFILLKKRQLLANPRLYVALLLSLIITFPIITWNIKNDFITYRFHSERVVISGHSSNWYNLLKAFIAQVVINNPVNVILAVTALITGLNRKIKSDTLTIFNFIGLPFIFILLFMSFFRITLPHWSGPAFVTLIPLAACWLAQVNKTTLFPVALKLSTGIYVFFLICCTLVINYYPGTFGKKTGVETGKGDMTIDMYGWQEAGKKFTMIYKNDFISGIMPKGTPVVCNNWWGAHEEYYFCRPAGTTMIGLGPLNDIHQYAWLNEKRILNANLNNAYCIIHSDENYNVRDHYGKYFSYSDTAAIIEIKRSNKPAHNFYILRLKGWKNIAVTTVP